MKRIFCLILCVALLGLALVSCKDDHVHQYNRQDWASDESGHWHASSCGCTDAGIKDKSAHVDEIMNDGLCDFCGYEVCKNEAHKTEWSMNENAHWHDTVCGHVGHIQKGDFEPHNDAVDGICDDCNHVCTNTQYNESWSSDADNHWHAASCGHDGHLPKIDVAAHEDADDDGYCDTCAYLVCENKDASAENAYDDDWSYDENKHWHAPSCGHTSHMANKDTAPHMDRDGDLACDECGSPVPAKEETN